MEDTRGTITLLTHEENVLTREGMLLLLDLHNKVLAVEYEGKSYSHACMKVPVTNIGLAKSRRRRRKRQPDEDTGQQSLEEAITIFYPQYDDYTNFYDTDKNDSNLEPGYISEDREDTLENLPKEVYCDIVETLEEKCGEYSILEIWKYDADVISNLTQQGPDSTK